MHVPIMFGFIKKIQNCINMAKMTLSFGLYPEVMSVAMQLFLKLITRTYFTDIAKGVLS